ncbi:MAG TPA: TIGR04282 family arsenosugar biosynthesis glycosyltransferase [Xanthobacteraceae bacterium]|jgi:rSAM/selenodomain-associated transferase 1
MAKSAIGVMCKAPLPGRAKTRLAATIGADAAARLSACFLSDVASTIEALPEHLACQGYGVYAPAGGEAQLREIFPDSFELLLQVDDQFSNVLHGAIRTLLAAGHDCVALVNGDSPTLPPAFLAEAINEMRRPGDRVVLGPATDGGYYLIGLKAAHRHLFTNIPWGTASVARLTLERAAEMGLETVCLPEWYDVDDAVTLEYLRDELDGRSVRFTAGGTAAATRAYLGSMAVAAK